MLQDMGRTPAVCRRSPEGKGKKIFLVTVKHVENLQACSLVAEVNSCRIEFLNLYNFKNLKIFV